jgi:hypothetical protein
MSNVYTTEAAGGSSSGSIRAESWHQAIVAIATAEVGAGSEPPLAVDVPAMPAFDEITSASTDEGFSTGLILETRWTPKMEQRFSKLVNKNALSSLTPDEQTELRRLQKHRRNLHHPRTVEEIELEYEQREATRRLVEAFQGYVKVFKVPHHTGTPTKEEIKGFELPRRSAGIGS